MISASQNGIDVSDSQFIYDDVLQLRCEPLSVVRMAFIGLGKRGKQSFQHFLYIDGVEVKALCDIYSSNLDEMQKLLQNFNKAQADLYVQPEDWKSVCERDDIDLIYIYVQTGVSMLKLLCMP